jgi:glycosidase
MAGNWVQFPLVYHLDARVWLAELSSEIGRQITLAEVPDAEIEKWSGSHFDAVWLMGVWQTGEQSRILALNNPRLRDDWTAVIPEWKLDDVVASPYSITDYRVAETLGGEPALFDLRKRLAQRGLKLILYFVPNHTAPEHHWVNTNREFYIAIPDERLEQMEQGAYFTVDAGTHLACGRAPNSPPWSDTLQLNSLTPAFVARSSRCFYRSRPDAMAFAATWPC